MEEPSLSDSWPVTKAIDELKYAAKKAKELGIEVVLEQHEDLKSSELVKIVKKVNQGLNTPHLFMLYDFGNMVNAFERPLEAFAQMKKWIRPISLFILIGAE